MKNWLIICCLLASCGTFGQSIKKKLYGTYEGTIPSYKVEMGTGVVDVNATAIRIQLLDHSVVQQLGNSTQTGTWKVEDNEKAYYVIIVHLQGQLTEERIILYKKTKTMTREGIFPQPDCELIRASSAQKH